MIQLHPKAQDCPHLPDGCFVRLPDGRLFTVAGKPGVPMVSADEGRTWAVGSIGHEGVELAPTGSILVTREGTLIVAAANLARRHWTWQDELHDAPGARLDTVVLRSTDGARTWEPPQTLHTAWTGATRDILQARDGRIVFTTMQMLHDPGRHAVMTYDSEDDGRTWHGSALLDLGGNGNHDGTMEATILELGDGSLLQLIRTNWGQLWRAKSRDSGRTWHVYGPSGIPASSTPAYLCRLADGRVAMVWNRPGPDDGSPVALRDGDGCWSATPASNYREELSLAFSDDDCRTWSTPTVVATNIGSEVSYPYLFEPTPGILWVTAHRWQLKMQIRVEDFV